MKNSLSIFAILILAAIMIAFTESRTITGKVTDQQGQPLAGSNCCCQRDSSPVLLQILMVITKLQLISRLKFLYFHFIGYTTVEEKIGDRTIINVIMKEEAVST